MQNPISQLVSTKENFQQIFSTIDNAGGQSQEALETSKKKIHHKSSEDYSY